MNIKFISDFVCPYCLVAKEALKQAVAEMGITPEIEWLPLELTVEPKPRVDTYHDEVRKAHYQVLVEPCRQLGIDMKLPPNVVPRPYTRLAFEGWYYAKDHGFGEAYNERMYTAYFTDEMDIGEIPVLKQIAAELGMDTDDFEKALIEGTYSEIEKRDVAAVHEKYEPGGVPTIYVNDEKIEINAYTKEEMIEILSGAWVSENGGGIHCDLDGNCG